MKLSGRLILVLTLGLWLLPMLTACGVFSDMAKDNEWRNRYLNSQDFVSPVKLKIGVLPFYDEIGMGTELAGTNTAHLLEQEFVKNKHLYVVPSAQMEEAMRARGLTHPISNADAVALGREMGLNAVVFGSISELKKYQTRRGWKYLFRLFTKQNEYVDAMLGVTALDTSTGIVLAARASTGSYVENAEERDVFNMDDTLPAPSQEAIENSLDKALRKTYYRTVDGLSSLPFKTANHTGGGESVTINYGSEVGFKRGQKFAVYGASETLVNSIGIPYELPGAPTARLVVEEVSDGHSRLRVTDGYVNSGDTIQSLPF